MKRITQRGIENIKKDLNTKRQKQIKTVKKELEAKRKEFDKINFNSLEAKLAWIRNFFNTYIPQLEERYMNKGDFKKSKFLPDEIRIQFYLYFPEHGLNMVHFAEECYFELECQRERIKRISQILQEYMKNEITSESIEDIEARESRVYDFKKT